MFDSFTNRHFCMRVSRARVFSSHSLCDILFFFFQLCDSRGGTRECRIGGRRKSWRKEPLTSSLFAAILLSVFFSLPPPSSSLSVDIVFVAFVSMNADVLCSYV